MNRFVFIPVALSLLCISGQAPHRKDPSVAVTKEVTPEPQELVVVVEAAPVEKKRVGAAKKILQGVNEVEREERKGAAQKVREGIE